MTGDSGLSTFKDRCVQNRKDMVDLIACFQKGCEFSVWSYVSIWNLKSLNHVALKVEGSSTDPLFKPSHSKTSTTEARLAHRNYLQSTLNSA